MRQATASSRGFAAKFMLKDLRLSQSVAQPANVDVPSLSCLRHHPGSRLAWSRLATLRWGEWGRCTRTFPKVLMLD